MTEDKNLKSKMKKNDEYMFMKEVRKPPRKKWYILKAILIILVGGVLMGVVAAVTFVKLFPYIEPYLEITEDVPNVEFPDDNYDDIENQSGVSQNGTNKPNSQNPNEGDGNVSSGVEVTPTPTDCPEKLTLEGFREVYQEIVDVAEECERAMVVVQGITSEVDWMNNSYENKAQVSGAIIAENVIYYYVLTEYRVLENVERIMITFCDGKTTLADFVKHDAATGLAILKIRKKDLSEDIKNSITVATLGSSWSIRRGETVIALGSPTGYSGSLAYGMVTSTNNVIPTIDTQYHLLTTDILGDSEGSGVIISLDGEIVGVMLQSFSMEKNQNVLTAIPISEIKKVLENLINDEDLIYMGILGQNITSQLQENTGIPKGVYVNSVKADSPAMKVGIQNGDVIVKMDSAKIENLQQFKSALSGYKKNDTVAVHVMRKGATGYVEIVFDVTLGAL